MTPVVEVKEISNNESPSPPPFILPPFPFFFDTFNNATLFTVFNYMRPLLPLDPLPSSPSVLSVKVFEKDPWLSHFLVSAVCVRAAATLIR